MLRRPDLHLENSEAIQQGKSQRTARTNPFYNQRNISHNIELRDKQDYRIECHFLLHRRVGRCIAGRQRWEPRKRGLLRLRCFTAVWEQPSSLQRKEQHRFCRLMDCFALLGRKHFVVFRRALSNKKFQRIPNPANRVRCARSLWPNRRSLQKQPRCWERAQGLKLITAEIHTYKYLNNINMLIIVERRFYRI